MFTCNRSKLQIWGEGGGEGIKFNTGEEMGCIRV